MSDSGRDTPVPEPFNKLSAPERDELFDWVRQLVNKAIGDFAEKVPSWLDFAMKERGLTSEMLGLLHLLAAKSGDSQQAVLEKALTLYGIALDAQEKGNHIAILNDDDEIVREIKGFEPADQIAEPVAH